MEDVFKAEESITNKTDGDVDERSDGISKENSFCKILSDIWNEKYAQFVAEKG